MEKNLKSITGQINTLQTNIKESEKNSLELQKMTEVKISETTELINSEKESFLNLNKGEIQNIIAEFKNKIELSLKKEHANFKELKMKKLVCHIFKLFYSNCDFRI